MALTDQQIAQRLLKKSQGVAETNFPLTARGVLEEAISTYSVVRPSDIWAEADKIPSVPYVLTDGQISGVTQYFEKLQLQITDGGTNVAFKSPLGQLQNAISGKFGFGYNFKVYGGAGGTTQIFKGDWLVDAESGILIFYSIGSTEVTVNAANPPYITFYKYVGLTGMTSGSDVAAISTALSVESSIRTSADSSLESSITGETSIRTSADQSLSNSISSEASIREYQDSLKVDTTTYNIYTGNTDTNLDYLQNQINELGAITSQVKFYFYNPESDVAGYEQLTTGIKVSAATESVVVNNSEQLIDKYLTESGFTFSDIPEGIWGIHFYASASAVTNGDNMMHFDLHKRTGGVDQFLFRCTVPITSTYLREYQGEFVLTGVTMGTSDRIVVYVYGATTASENRTISWSYGDFDRFAYIHTPLVTNASPLWSSIQSKPEWLSGTTIQEFEAGHNHPVLSDSISTEASIRSSVDSSLESTINGLTGLTNQLSTEASIRSSVDSSLESTINGLTGLTNQLSTEASIRSSVDTSLETSINGLTGLTSELSSEISTRESADASLASAIQSSTPTGLTSAISSLNTALSTEISTRESADTSLESTINGLTGLTSELSTEISIRSSADSSLESTINGLTGLTSELSTEISIRSSADSSLETAIINKSGVTSMTAGSGLSYESANQTLNVVVDNWTIKIVDIAGKSTLTTPLLWIQTDLTTTVESGTTGQTNIVLDWNPVGPVSVTVNGIEYLVSITGGTSYPQMPFYFLVDPQFVSKNDRLYYDSVVSGFGLQSGVDLIVVKYHYIDDTL